MASVAIRNLQKNFGSTEAVKGVSIDIADGEFVVLVGPSGCGKSTLLRMIAGLEDISGGELVVNGKVINSVAAKDRDIAMVFQNYALYPHMTVADNMGFSMQLKKLPKATVRQEVEKVADALGLGNLLGRRPRELSGGQRQRVAMGRAIVRDPQVFLFDEPLSNLDAKLRVQMRGEIKALHQRLGTTTVYVTHDQIEAMMMADKIVVLRDGRIEQAGTPLELYDRPANAFVAGFIGSPSMNFLPGKIESGRFVTDGGVVFPDEVPNGTAEGARVLMGLRPEHISIADDGIQAKIVLVEPTGSETQVLAQLPGGQAITCVFHERIAAHPGGVIFLRPDAGTYHFFEPDGGARMH